MSERCYCGALDCEKCHPGSRDVLECPSCGEAVERHNTDEDGLCPQCSDEGLEKCMGCLEWKQGVEDDLCPECRGEGVEE